MNGKLCFSSKHEENGCCRIFKTESASVVLERIIEDKWTI